MVLVFDFEPAFIVQQFAIEEVHADVAHFRVILEQRVHPFLITGYITHYFVHLLASPLLVFEHVYTLLFELILFLGGQRFEFFHLLLLNTAVNGSASAVAV